MNLRFVQCTSNKVLKELMLVAITMSDGKEFQSFITLATQLYFFLKNFRVNLRFVQCTSNKVLKELMLVAITMSDGKEFQSFITLATKLYFFLKNFRVKDQSENSAIFTIQHSLHDHSAILQVVVCVGRKELVTWRPIQKSRRQG